MDNKKLEIMELAKKRFEGIEQQILDEVKHLLNSGAVDPENCNCGLLFGVAVENIADKWLINERKSKSYKNLKMF
jgi:hypothetical protein